LDSNLNKKLFISTLLICCTTLTFAQGFSFGAKTSLRNTWLFNKANTQVRYKPTLGANFGGFATWYLVDTRSTLKRVIGFEVEYLYSSTNQNYSINTPTRGLVITRNQVTSIDIPVLVRFKPSFTQNQYFEAGINFGSLKEVNYTDTLGNRLEVTQKFLKNNISFVFGGGSDFTIYKNIKWTIGLRAQIGIADIGGVDGAGRAVGDNTIFKTSNPTTTFDFGVITGIHYLFYKK
jgi:hypothetical protein